MNKYFECETLEDVKNVLKGVIKSCIEENWIYDHCVDDEAKDDHINWLLAKFEEENKK